MNKTALKLTALAGLAMGAPAVAETRVPPEEASIPYADRDGIVEWKVDGDRGLYIRGMTGGWFYARTLGKCGRLQTADTLGFETSATGDLDRHGAIRAQGWRCPLTSVVRSEGPPEDER